MSILTECNYCKYQAIVKFQKKVGNRVVKILSTKQVGGWEICALKKGENGEKISEENWIAWMIEITDHCVC